MKILFITHHYLSCNGGSSFASRAYINAFAELSDEMTLFYPVKLGEDLFDGINSKIKTIPIEYNKSKWIKLFHLLIGRVHRYYRIARTIKGQGTFDIVVFDTSIVSYKLIDLFKKTGAKIIVIHHNYQYEYFRDNITWWLKLPTLFWCQRYEGEAVRKADLNLTLTKQDIKLLADHYNEGNNSMFSLLGTFEYKSLQSTTIDCDKSRLHRFVITGNLGAMQTKRSLALWINQYYPILKDVFSDASLTIAGRNPDEKLTGLCKKYDIDLVPNPESLDLIMSKADYYICPICLGGGLKLRIMDGLKWGLPVIAHYVSTRGYDKFVEKGCIFSYIDTYTFRKSLLVLKQSDFSRQSVFEDYHSIFSFEAGKERIKKILDNTFNLD